MNIPEMDARFQGSHSGFIEQFQGVIVQLVEHEPPIAEPDLLSKLEGTLEFLLVKRGCELGYQLVNDNGWMVSRAYEMAPKRYIYGSREFYLVIMADPESAYILLDFGLKNYVVFGCSLSNIPWFDDDRDLNILRIGKISQHLAKNYFQKFNPIPRLPKGEADFLKTNFLHGNDANLVNIQQSILLRRFGAMIPNKNGITRLYRILVFLLEQLGCDVDVVTNAPLMENYVCSLVKFESALTQFYFSIVEGINFFLFAVKDDQRRLIKAFRIPSAFILEFGIFPAAIFRDNQKLDALFKFVEWIMLEVSKESKRRALSRSSSVSELYIPSPDPDAVDSDGE